ncbi:MAG TPA: S8 family serine peptidase [Xanthomonadales bacterium]|nr:S8 family serine peptidase [Xanthomonadales bacterium]
MRLSKTTLRAAILAALALASLDASARKLDLALERRLATATSTTPLEVIVTFPGSGAPTAAQVGLLESLGLKAMTLRELPIAAAVATPAQVRALVADPSVRSVFLNAPLAYENEQATELTGVDRLRRDASLRAGTGLPFTGKGVGVLVNDSGIDGLHPDLKYPQHVVQNVLAQTNLQSWETTAPITYVEGVPQTDILAGHGTHCAGIIGGTGAAVPGARFEGVAPGAGIVGYGSGAALFVLDSLGGFDYALNHQAQYGIRVVSNSFGNTSDTGTPFDPDDPTNVATKALADRGVVVVFSAGNSGPGEATITGNFKKAPWVVLVAAGDKQGRLATFSSRGVREGGGGTVVIDGETLAWEDRPTVAAPGVDIYSARDSLSDGLGALALQEEIDEIGATPALYYTKLSGTSMAAPHISGVVALMLEANPMLSWREVKRILRDTATNIPGTEPWESGAGYVNAHAAVRAALGLRQYPELVNASRQFNARARIGVAAQSNPSIAFSPVGATGSHTFQVGADIALVQARANVGTNTVALVLIDPTGKRYGSSISLPQLGPNIATSAPGVPGTWTLTVRGIGAVSGVAVDPAGATNGYGAPGTVVANLQLLRSDGYDGLDDVAGHPAQGFIELAVRERLVDGDADGLFRPDAALTRGMLADFLVMGSGVRQPAATPALADVPGSDPLYAAASAVLARGAALRDLYGTGNGVMRGTRLDRDVAVTRQELAYSLVQSLGLQAQASQPPSALTALFDGRRVPVRDAASIDPALRGHAQLALDLGLVPARFAFEPGGFGQPPVVVAYFDPAVVATRADYAAAATRRLAVSEQ